MHVPSVSQMAPSSGNEQTGMLEAHVRELPEHVVPEHEAAVGGGADDRVHRGHVHPEHVVGRTGVRAGRPRRSTPW